LEGIKVGGKMWEKYCHIKYINGWKILQTSSPSNTKDVEIR